MANIPAGTSIMTMKLVARVRSARMWNGIKGSLTRRSIIKKVPSRATPRTSAIIVTGAVHACEAFLLTSSAACVRP